MAVSIMFLIWYGYDLGLYRIDAHLASWYRIDVLMTTLDSPPWPRITVEVPFLSPTSWHYS